jgi:hypothetical protein
MRDKCKKLITDFKKYYIEKNDKYNEFFSGQRIKEADCTMNSLRSTASRSNQ